MKQFLLFLGLVLLGTAALAQDAPAQDAPAQDAPVLATQDLVAQLGPLRVARTLKLRPDQVLQIKPLLEQVQAARDAQKAAQDALLERAGESLARVDQALVMGRKASQADVNAADRAARDNKAALADTDKAIAAAAQQIYRLLDQDQAKLVETEQQQRARDQEAARFSGLSLAEHITGYVVAMRKLLPEEYGNLRVAMGLRLAGLLVSPDNQNFNTAVDDVLKVMDTVRRLSDADFAQRQAQLPLVIGRALRLNVATAGPSAEISYGDFTDFVAGEQTLQALAAYVPAAAKEGQQ